MEIERKFLIKDMPEPNIEKSDEIIQGYISLEPEIRVRKKGNKYYICEKSDGDIVREEYEKEITEQEFRCLLLKAGDRIIEKTRYYIPIGKNLCELDVYKGRHEGLAVAEIEFPDEETAKAFIPPAWFGEEVSCKKEFKNKNLSVCLPEGI